MKDINKLALFSMIPLLSFCKNYATGNYGNSDSSFYDTKIGYNENEFADLFTDEVKKNPSAIEEIKKNLQVSVEVEGDAPDCTKYKQAVALKSGISVGASVKGGCNYKFKVALLSRSLDANFAPKNPPEMIVYFQSNETAGVAKRINKGDGPTKIPYQLCPTESVKTLFKPKAACVGGGPGGDTDVTIDINFQPPKPK